MPGQIQQSRNADRRVKPVMHSAFLATFTNVWAFPRGGQK
jgi:hypothetical protein